MTTSDDKAASCRRTEGRRPHGATPIRSLLLATLLTIGAAAAPQAMAACAARDLDGRWDIYATSTLNGVSVSLRCALRIGDAGATLAGACSDGEGVLLDVVGGRFTVRRSGRFAAEIDFRDPNLPGDPSSFVIEQATLTRSKEMFAGVATLSGPLTSRWAWDGVRR